MQEIGIVLKSLHELEFLVAYQKQMLSSNSKCTCNTFVCNLKEFYRVYFNMKNLTTFLKNEICKLYAENCRLNELLSEQLFTRKLANQEKRSSASMLSLNELQNQLTHHKKQTGHSTCRSITRKNDFKSEKILNNNLYIEEATDENEFTYTFIKSSPFTTTIAQAIEDTESELALRHQTPFNYLHNKMNTKLEVKEELSCSSSASSFTSSGYSSQIPVTKVMPIKKLITPVDSAISSASSSLLKTNNYSLKTNLFEALTFDNVFEKYESNATKSNVINYNITDNELTTPNHQFHGSDLQHITAPSIASSSNSSSPNSLVASPQCAQTLAIGSFKTTLNSKTNLNKMTKLKNVSASCGDSLQSAHSTSSSLSMSSHNLPINLNQTQLPRSNTIAGEEYEDIRDEETEKKRISKGRIIDELIQTEMDYYKVMKLLYDVYLGPNSENIIEPSQKEAIFCNLKDIMNLSSLLLNDFETNILNRSFEHVKIGKCFLNNANSIRQIYAHYAQFIEYSNNILEKNEKVAEVQLFIQNGLSIIKQQTTSAFDLHSLLLKPIQRVLKYPLLLQELIKVTEAYHDDFDDLNQALTCMHDVATYINEIKRRRELIVKYGRKDKDHSTIQDKMAKLTIHSVIKKSNRISMKLSNVLGLGGVSTVDEEFNRLEAKFHYFEKLIKSFSKDSIQHLTNLKEFLKVQTITAESVQEYYGDYRSHEIQQYVRINADMLNEIYAKNTNFVHEKVLKPLNDLLKLLEVPNKLIQKRKDKLLDYECARSNYDKLKDKNLIKAVTDNLHETKKNYEALNNQLLEELPTLIDKCASVFEKCFLLYLTALKNIHERIRHQLSSLNSSFAVDSQETNESLNRIKAKDTNNSLLNFEQTLANQLNNLSEKFSIKSNFNSETNLEKADFNTCSLNRKMSFKGPKLNEMKRKNTLFNNPVVQMLKSLTSNDAMPPTPKQTLKTPTKIAEKPTKQNNEIRNKLLRTYKKDDLFIACCKHSGFGITSELALEVDDIVGVLKKADPCGNSNNWFVDNGIIKGIISSSILKPLNEKLQADCPAKRMQSTVTSSEQLNQSGISNTNESNENTESNNHMHNYVNTSKEEECQNAEYCRALYHFKAIDDTTMSVNEGDNLRVIQKHDDNFNHEWWLLEKILKNKQDYRFKTRGYVPSNYVELIYSTQLNTTNVNEYPIEIECERKGIHF